MNMNRKLSILLMVVALLIPGLAFALDQGDFEVKTTQNLMNLCTAAPSDPNYQAAIHFCHGYLVGAYDYYAASHVGPHAKHLFCLPNPTPSRNDAIDMFVEWAKAHPQHMGEKPVDTEFRFLIEKWPCKK
jgi:hypothetical protein